MKRLTVLLTLLFLSGCPLVTLSSEHETSLERTGESSSIEVSEMLENSSTLSSSVESKENSNLTEQIEQTEQTNQKPASLEKQVTSLTLEKIESPLGTEQNPYVVKSADELVKAIDQPLTSGSSKKWIELGADISYKSAHYNTSITVDTEIEGHNYHILYANSTSATDHTFLIAKTEGVNIHFKNIQFGNASNPYGSWYGILCVYAKNVHFTVENINYNITDGAQPFYGNDNTGAVLIFKGKNTFNMSASRYGGEFVERIPTVIFSENSETTVYHDTYHSSAVLWNVKDFIVEKNAIVNLSSSKDYFSYSATSVKVKIEENGVFNYKRIKGINQTGSNSYLYVDSLYVGKNATVHFETEVNPFSYSNFVIQANSPNFILFDTINPTQSILNQLQLTFHRMDNDGETYSINSLASQGEKEVISNLMPNSNQVVSSKEIDNGYSIVYARNPKIKESSANQQTAPGISRIKANILDWSLPTEKSKIKKAYFKLSDRKLYKSDDVMQLISQQQIEIASSSNGVIDSSEKEIPETEWNDLPPKDYFIYMKIEDERIPGYALKSYWIEKKITLLPYLSLSLPEDGFKFTKITPGDIGQTDNLKDYLLSNKGNTPIKISLNKLMTNDISDSEVHLVKDIVDYMNTQSKLSSNVIDKNKFLEKMNSVQKINLADSKIQRKEHQLEMYLVLENKATKVTSTWGPLQEGATQEMTYLLLQPYWEEDSQALGYIEGKFEGPMNGVRHVSYQITLGIDQY